MKPLAYQIGLQGLLTVIAIVLVLSAQARWGARSQSAFGVVDLNAVYRQKEAEFARRVSEARTDAEHERAMQDARAFAQQLPLALQALPQECRCLVLLSSAVISPPYGALDLTPALRQKLDLP